MEKSGVLPSRLTPRLLPRSTPGRQANQTVRVNCSLRLLLCTAAAHPLKKLKYSVLAPSSTNSSPPSLKSSPPPQTVSPLVLHRSVSVRSSFVVVVMLVVVPTLLDFIITISSRHLPSLSPPSYSFHRVFLARVENGTGAHSLARVRRGFFEFISRKRGAAECPVFQIVLMGDVLYAVRRLAIASLADLSPSLSFSLSVEKNRPLRTAK